MALRSDIPPYAAKVLSLPKVVARAVNFDTLEGLGHCDVAHRMVQPDQWFSVDRWRTVADRVVVTVLDMIAYRNGAYHEDTGKWLLYRDALRRVGATDADAVVLISEDVKVQVEMERLPVDPQRLHAIPFGTEHLTGDEPTEMPRELMARGFVEGQFILCLGTDYAHKNRDLAMAVIARSPRPRPCARPRDGRPDRALRVVASSAEANFLAAPSRDTRIGGLPPPRPPFGRAQLAGPTCRSGAVPVFGEGIRAGSLRSGALRDADTVHTVRPAGGAGTRHSGVRRGLVPRDAWRKQPTRC